MFHGLGRSDAGSAFINWLVYGLTAMLSPCCGCLLIFRAVSPFRDLTTLGMNVLGVLPSLLDLSARIYSAVARPLLDTAMIPLQRVFKPRGERADLSAAAVVGLATAMFKAQIVKAPAFPQEPVRDRLPSTAKALAVVLIGQRQLVRCSDLRPAPLAAVKGAGPFSLW